MKEKLHCHHLTGAGTGLLPTSLIGPIGMSVSSFHTPGEEKLHTWKMHSTQIGQARDTQARRVLQLQGVIGKRIDLWVLYVGILGMVVTSVLEVQGNGISLQLAVHHAALLCGEKKSTGT